MSSTKVKTTYSIFGDYGSTEKVTLYCHHNHSTDSTIFYDEDGNVQLASFHEFVEGDDLWDAMQRLWIPFKDKWHGQLKDRVEYYVGKPWDSET